MEFSAKVTGLTRYIPVYGLPDVKEVLHLISSTRAATLSETRPLKILYYLQVDHKFITKLIKKKKLKEVINKRCCCYTSVQLLN